jgi:hypothetical protein
VIVTSTAFARQCGVSKQAISKAIRTGLIEPTDDGLIDTDHPSAVYYAETQASRPPGKRAGGRPPRSGVVREEAPTRRLPGTPGVVRPMGTAYSKQELEVERIKQQVIHLRLKNQVATESLVSKDLVVKYVFQPVSTAHMRILTDGVRAMSAQIVPMVQSGASLEDVEKHMRKALGNFFRAAKKTRTDFVSGETTADDHRKDDSDEI